MMEGQNLLKIKQSEMDGKICQNIKPPTPTHIPSSVQLSTWGNEKIRLQTVFILFVIR